MRARLQPPPQLVATGVMAILRAPSADRVVPAAQALAEGGITCLEITLNTPAALEVLASVRQRLPRDIAVGAGTVITPEQVREAAAAGAEFLVSPHVDPELIASGADLGLPTFPGAFTATEVLLAWRSGASAVKLFPAATAGPDYLTQLRGPLSDIYLVPTGGLHLEDLAAYVSAGALAVGLGGPLLGDALSGGSLAAVVQRAKRALDTVAAARQRRAH